MGLALGADVGDQRVRLELVGLPQDRAGDIDRIVEGEFVDDIDRGLVEAGQPPRQLGAGRHFDLVREPSDDLAEGPDFILAVAAGDHQVGGMPQRPGAALGGPPRHRLVEIRKKRFCRTHFLQTLDRNQPAQICARWNSSGQTRVFRKVGKEVLSLKIRSNCREVVDLRHLIAAAASARGSAPSGIFPANAPREASWRARAAR